MYISTWNGNTGYRLEAVDTGTHSNDITRTDAELEACYYYCDTIPGCIGFIHVRVPSACVFKSYFDNFVREDGQNIYMKINGILFFKYSYLL